MERSKKLALIRAGYSQGEMAEEEVYQERTPAPIQKAPDEYDRLAQVLLVCWTLGGFFMLAMFFNFGLPGAFASMAIIVPVSVVIAIVCTFLSSD